jgi:hypothetical protein
LFASTGATPAIAAGCFGELHGFTSTPALASSLHCCLCVASSNAASSGACIDEDDAIRIALCILIVAVVGTVVVGTVVVIGIFETPRLKISPIRTRGTPTALIVIIILGTDAHARDANRDTSRRPRISLHVGRALRSRVERTRARAVVDE